jgi:hypothetical protein
MDSTAIIFVSVVLFALALVLSKALLGWYHEIEKRNRYMEVQIRLLGHIAAKSNVNPDKIAELIISAKMPNYAVPDTSGNKALKESIIKAFEEMYQPKISL